MGKRNDKMNPAEVQAVMGYVRVRKAGEDVTDDRTVEFVASDGSRDSHGTVLPPEKWNLERFNRNGIIGYQHNVYGDLCGNEDPDRVIGTGEARVEDGELIVRITFEPAELNPLAEKIYRKVKHGTLKAVSVGFIPEGEGHWGEGDEAEDGKRATYYYGGMELLEVSVVNIPSNANALRRGVRDNTADALRYVYRALGGEYRFSEIEEMKVGDVLDMLSGENGRKAEDPDRTEHGTESRDAGTDDDGDSGTETEDAGEEDVEVARAMLEALEDENQD